MGKYDDDDYEDEDDRGRPKNAKRKPVRAEYDDEEDEDDRAQSSKRKPVRAEYDDEEDEDRDRAKSSKRKPVRAEYDEEDEEDEDDYEERPRKRRRPEKRLRPGRCPQCSSSRSSGVHFTWWGGFIGPMIFGLVRCDRCGQEYSKGSGKPFGFTQILIYSLVVGGIAGFIGITLAILGN